eukprot:TRINITY_DN2065_c0_g1_i1.p1 TRINITY_DN2065_c0_g1~~TRINITY_DN2065_c0_g1_i1.p1  ORF type:complete len:316 (-),score=94.81 TRINITY_DN2065_c0_g1_i1:22-969(-)
MGAWLTLLLTPSTKVVTVKGSRYIIEKTLGEGGFAIVYSVYNPQTYQRFALKKIIAQTEEGFASAKTEQDVLTNFRHKNLLHAAASDIVNSSIQGAKEFYFLMPLFRQGTLQDVLDVRKTSGDKAKKIDQKNILNTFLGACEGVREFHKHDPPKSHNDIKPANMMMNSGEIILFDFGSVSIARHQITSRQQALTLQEWADSHCSPLFKAPELFNITSDAVIDERTDIWSLGCSLFALLFNYSPFEEAAISGSIALAVESGAKFPQEASQRYSEQLLDLTRRMLSVDPKQRPFIDEVIQSINQMLHEDQVSIDLNL